MMTWGTPIGRFGPRDRELLRGMSSPQRLRGYSDDAPILKLKLPLHDAKLSDTTWLSKVRVLQYRMHHQYSFIVSRKLLCFSRDADA